MALLVQHRSASIEAYEHFEKQSYRNRCVIYGPNGPQNLIVPVDRSGWRSPIKDLKISYAEDWVANHLRALESAYNNSAFFAVLGDELFNVIQKKHNYLFDLNMELLHLLLNWLQDEEIQITTTENYQKPAANTPDLRLAISPKKESLLIDPPVYYQQFSGKHGHATDLSVIDLIFSEGRAAWDYLNDVKLAMPIN